MAFRVFPISVFIFGEELQRQWSSIRYLSHYSDTVGQWYRSVVGKCLNILGTPGNSDYFEAENAGEENLGHLQGRCIYRMYIYIYDI